jgi:hypothetical protein
MPELPNRVSNDSQPKRFHTLERQDGLQRTKDIELFIADLAMSVDAGSRQKTFGGMWH